MGERERILAGNAETWKSRIVSREKGLLDFASQLKISLKNGILRFQFFGRGLEPVAFLRQCILHLFHGGEILVDSTDADDVAAHREAASSSCNPKSPFHRMNEPLDLSDHGLAAFP